MQRSFVYTLATGVLFMGLMVSGASAATASWTQPVVTTHPLARDSAAMATDRNGNVILFGGVGTGPFGFANDTWLWDGARWIQPTLASSPSGRASAAISRDKNGAVVLFGGCCSPLTGQVQNDTWLWDGAGWAQVAPAMSPPIRSQATLAKDKNGNLVLFGGCCDFSTGQFRADTWLWDGSNWTQASPSMSPPGRGGAGVATDKNGNVVLFGGFGATGYLNDTWLWDGSNWRLASPSVTPSARVGAALSAHTNGDIVLFGGFAFGTLDSDTWIWDGTTWIHQPSLSSPPARTSSTLASDKRGNIVLFGGLGAGFVDLSDTWLFSLATSGCDTDDSGNANDECRQ